MINTIQEMTIQNYFMSIKYIWYIILIFEIFLLCIRSLNKPISLFLLIKPLKTTKIVNYSQLLI